MPYAQRTDVSRDKSLIEIKRVLVQYGANKVAFSEEEETVNIGFELEGRRYRFTLNLPDRELFRVRRVGKHGGTRRSDADVDKAWDQGCREKYRALFLAIKAKMVAVESGIETVEQAFMAHLLLPNGQTMADWADDQLEQVFLSGRMPPLLGSGQ
jgi:hypothetical protein